MITHQHRAETPICRPLVSTSVDPALHGIADVDLVARYDRRIPRYTSYPTAPQFTPDIGADVYAEWLEALAPDTALSLYLHIPFCAELCLYCGCHTTVVRRHEPIASYVRLLGDEIDLVTQRLGGRRPTAHIHWGGVRSPEYYK